MDSSDWNWWKLTNYLKNRRERDELWRIWWTICTTTIKN